MASSKLLKERIESIQDTRKITNAMYLISSSKLRKARKNYQNVLPYFTRMRDTISRVVPHLPDEPVHPFFHERQREDGDPRRAYLVLTADKGMAGSFNQNVLKLLLEKADRNDRFYVIGQVGYRALRKDPRLVQEFQYGATAPSLQRARDITVDAIDDFKSGKLDEIYLIYTKIQNALTSEPVMVRLLPLDREHLQPTPKGLGDPRGEVELVPDAWTVFEQTAPIYMHGMIFGAMTESFCAEQSARMTAMDSATKNANDMIRELQLPRPLSGDFSSLYFKQLLLTVQRQIAEGGKNKPQIQKDMEHAVQFFHENFSADIDISNYAASLHMSTCWFIRSFKQYVGVPPCKYLTSIRINKAKELLESTNCPVSEIGSIIGYENPLYFSRIFKKQTGLSPAAYRKVLP